jgi:hypothetical protein
LSLQERDRPWLAALKAALLQQPELLVGVRIKSILHAVMLLAA